MSAPTARSRSVPRAPTCARRRWGIAVLSGGLVCGCLGGGPPVGAASVDLARRLELLPGARWMDSGPSGICVAVAQPVAGLPARSAALALTDRRRGPLTLALDVTSLRAAAVNELAGAVQARAQGERIAGGARLEAVQMTVAAVESRGHARGAVWALLGGTRLAVGARWEGPLRDAVGLPPAQVEWCARAALSGCAISVARTSSRYGLEASWRLGLRARLGPDLSLGLRAGAGESELVSNIRIGHGALTVGLPVASRMGAGIALGLSWFRGDRP